MFSAKELKAKQRSLIKSKVNKSSNSGIRIPNPQRYIDLDITISDVWLNQTNAETVLEDTYPVHPGYVYIVDGVVTRSYIKGFVSDLKRELNASIVMNCELFAEQPRHIGDNIILKDSIIIDYIKSHTKDIHDPGAYRCCRKYSFEEVIQYLHEYSLLPADVIFAKRIVCHDDAQSVVYDYLPEGYVYLIKK